ncbi:MAG: LysM peptidoglycan-binding domain-containing protein [bacterium]
MGVGLFVWPLSANENYRLPPEMEVKDFPIRMDKRVQSLVKLYTTKKRDQIGLGIKRSGRYMPLIRRELHSAGLPQDLAYVVAAESNFNVKARSHMGAVGLWQFIAPTGKRYGLRIDNWVDERRDPVKATQAAIAYLSVLYERFHDWELAMAGYNAGENRVERAIRYNRSRKRKTDFRSLRLPRETRGYVPSIMALAVIHRNPSAYGLSWIQKDPPMDEAQVALAVSYSLEEISTRVGIPFSEFRLMNAQYYRSTPPLTDDKYTFYLPKVYHEKLLLSLKEKPQPSLDWIAAYSSHLGNSRAVTNILQRHGEPMYIRVRSGDNLWDLARKHNTTVNRLATWNGLKTNSLLRVNQRLKIYIPTWEVVREVAKNRSAPQQQSSRLVSSNTPLKVKVPEGVSLEDLSRRYDISPSKLRELNHLEPGEEIKAGQQLVVGQHVVRTRKIRVPRGSTLSGLARRYKVSVGKLMEWNHLSSARSLKAGQSLIVAKSLVPATYARPADGYRTIRVPRNATLSGLALRHKVSVEQLLAWNNMDHPRQLKAGQRLIVSERRLERPAANPGNITIRVQRGDTLWQLARKYGTSVKNLVALNNLNPRSPLYPNQKLIVPNNES